MSLHQVTQTSGALPPVTTEILVVGALVLVVFVLFVAEPIPLDVIAVGVIVALVVLEPWTDVAPTDALSGFSSAATITVLAMFVLSEGIRRTGVINRLARGIASRYGESPRKQLAAVLGIAGGSAGFINNTPVVAVMIPLVSELSRKTGVSPSKLLLPVSYAALFGGMLTLIGTSTNILASDVWDRIGGEASQPFSMFEFTSLGVLVLAVGIAYLLFVGDRLIPARIPPDEELTEEFEMAPYLTEVIVRSDSPLAGRTASEWPTLISIDADIVRVVRDDRPVPEPLAGTTLREGDILVLRTTRRSLFQLIDTRGLEFAPHATVTDEQLEGEPPARYDEAEPRLVEVVIAPATSLVGETLDRLQFEDRYGTTVLAIRRGAELIHARMGELPLRGGDTLLVQTSQTTAERLSRNRNFVVVQEVSPPELPRGRTPTAVGIVAGVVAIAALELLPIEISALAGVVAMVATGCLKPGEVYDAVNWSVIFLLAGLIPLGLALERSGAAAYLASVLVVASAGAPPIVVLGLFYLLTALITELISNNASVVLMIPVAIDAAAQIGANQFAFVLAVTFAASTPLMTPIGYQTNLMVYGPGGYRFTDYARVGAPLQLILTVVTTAGIAAIWGL
ncbi:SLC13 family permease [Haloferacaceae archaeon DSL9]